MGTHRSCGPSPTMSGCYPATACSGSHLVISAWGSTCCMCAGRAFRLCILPLFMMHSPKGYASERPGYHVDNPLLLNPLLLHTGYHWGRQLCMALSEDVG